jgi:hypothetical protein
VQHILKFCSVANLGACLLLTRFLYQNCARKWTGHGGPILRSRRLPDLMNKSINQPDPRDLFPPLKLAFRQMNLVSLIVRIYVGYISGKNIIKSIHFMRLPCGRKPVVFPDKPNSVVVLQAKHHKLNTLYIFCRSVILGRRRRTR